MEVGTAVVLMEATSLPALGSLMARQICFLPESGDEMMMMVVRAWWWRRCCWRLRKQSEALAGDDVSADQILQIIRTKMQYGRQSHGVDGSLPEHVTCERA